MNLFLMLNMRYSICKLTEQCNLDLIATLWHNIGPDAAHQKGPQGNSSPSSLEGIQH
jgi:hypothetical protein